MTSEPEVRQARLQQARTVLRRLQDRLAALGEKTDHFSRMERARLLREAEGVRRLVADMERGAPPAAPTELHRPADDDEVSVCSACKRVCVLVGGRPGGGVPPPIRSACCGASFSTRKPSDRTAPPAPPPPALPALRPAVSPHQRPVPVLWQSRIAILRALADGAATGTEIARQTGLTGTNVSQRLTLLLRDGLVTWPRGRRGRGSPVVLTEVGRALLVGPVPQRPGRTARLRALCQALRVLPQGVRLKDVARHLGVRSYIASERVALAVALGLLEPYERRRGRVPRALLLTEAGRTLAEGGG